MILRFKLSGNTPKHFLTSQYTNTALIFGETVTAKIYNR